MILRVVRAADLRVAEAMAMPAVKTELLNKYDYFDGSGNIFPGFSMTCGSKKTFSF